ncbi:MAG: homoserine dehydrogenase, partial [Clostridia bacterium]|nr:homoserine dehydrogenase [Clostridia bacterium]
MLQIALLGFGVVGSGTAEVITKNQKQIAAYCGDEVNVKYILDLREFPEHPLGDRIVHNIDVILNDPEVVLVAEMMGGSHPAYDFTSAALKAGKHVVTANKEVVANFGVELLNLARENHVSYLFEASVGGGIPIIRPMQTDLASNEILAVSGILNGTTNFILTKMKNEGAAFADVLKLAQEKGYAEANPAADVEGLDAARKIVILAALAFGKLLNPNKISTTGITGII